MPEKKSNALITAELLLVMIFWGGNNAAMKYQIRFWPPVFTASMRFLCAGLLLLAIMRWTPWLGRPSVLSAEQRRLLWSRVGLPLALYIAVFVWALKFTSASSVALFMGTSPVWALVWEERPSRRSAHRYAAACLALCGVVVLFLPALQLQSSSWTGNLLGLFASVLWTFYSRQSKTFGAAISGLELTGQSFWRAGVLLLPLAAIEVGNLGVVWEPMCAALLGYGIVFSGLIAFGLWNDALRAWPTSRAFLFGNLIPVTTMTFAHFFLDEPITTQFWLALSLILTAVLIGQADWRRILNARWFPGE